MIFPRFALSTPLITGESQGASIDGVRRERGGRTPGRAQGYADGTYVHSAQCRQQKGVGGGRVPLFLLLCSPRFYPQYIVVVPACAHTACLVLWEKMKPCLTKLAEPGLFWSCLAA